MKVCFLKYPIPVPARHKQKKKKKTNTKTSLVCSKVDTSPILFETLNLYCTVTEKRSYIQSLISTESKSEPTTQNV
jgi:hypothetical protein